MKRSFPAVLSAFFLIVFFSSPAGAAASLPGRGPEVGEHLLFDVYWMGARVGVGELEVKEKILWEGREVLHVVAKAKTNDFLSKIYPVEDEIHSYLDPQTLHSLKFRKTLKEGRYRADEEVRYFPEKKKAEYESFRSKMKTDFEIPGPVHDIVSAFYWFRTQPLEVHRSIKTTVNNKMKDWSVELQVLGRQTKELRGGRSFDTFLVEPKTRLKGVLDKRGRVWIHLTADEKRTPVLITFKTPFGPVIGVLRTH